MHSPKINNLGDKIKTRCSWTVTFSIMLLFKNSGECNQWLNISFCRKIIIALVLDTLIVANHCLAQSDIDH